MAKVLVGNLYICLIYRHAHAPRAMRMYSKYILNYEFMINSWQFSFTDIKAAYVIIFGMGRGTQSPPSPHKVMVCVVFAVPMLQIRYQCTYSPICRCIMIVLYERDMHVQSACMDLYYNIIQIIFVIVDPPTQW